MSHRLHPFYQYVNHASKWKAISPSDHVGLSTALLGLFMDDLMMTSSPGGRLKLAPPEARNSLGKLISSTRLFFKRANSRCWWEKSVSAILLLRRRRGHSSFNNYSCQKLGQDLSKPWQVVAGTRKERQSDSKLRLRHLPILSRC